MNYLYFSKKLSICSAYLNLISSLGWISLVLLISYYHVYVLNTGNEYYKSFPWKNFVLSPFENLKQRTPVSSVQSTNAYSSAYIGANGLHSFFSEGINGSKSISYWTLIQPIYLTSITSSSTNLLLSFVSWFCFVKARDFNYLIASLANLFIPILGGLLTLKIHSKLSKVWGPKATKCVGPAQLFKLKTKLLVSKAFSETTIPSY